MVLCQPLKDARISSLGIKSGQQKAEQDLYLIARTSKHMQPGYQNF